VSVVLRLLAMAAVLACAWPEWHRYRVERDLATASAILARRLQGDAGAVPLLADAVAMSRQPAYPGDARAPLLHGIALLLAARPAEARATFERAIAVGEHPELVHNLGRARAATGDEYGARIAFLRSAWAAPSAIATLPAAMRALVEADVAINEAALRAGRLAAPPPLE
jgi:hypothetical protein